MRNDLYFGVLPPSWFYVKGHKPSPEVTSDFLVLGSWVWVLVLFFSLDRFPAVISSVAGFVTCLCRRTEMLGLKANVGLWPVVALRDNASRSGKNSGVSRRKSVGGPWDTLLAPFAFSNGNLSSTSLAHDFKLSRCRAVLKG